ncbi:hypothetical protein [Providencia hangzhouensis]|uniref:hypothetical protein n=1 Tax=Providencia hangzhouensis TaxID=3031799 RepID=UPI0039F58DEF
MKLKVNRGTLLAVMECMAVRDVRYYINGICFLPDGKVVGTNGYMLAYGHHDNDITDQVILSVGKLPTKTFEYAVFDTEEEIVKLHSESGFVVGVGLCSVIDGRYPNINPLIESTAKADEKLPPVLIINSGYLSKLEKVAKFVNPRMPAYEIRVKSDSDAVVCEVKNPHDERVTVMIMPMRL